MVAISSCDPATWAASATKEDMLAILETDAAVVDMTSGKIAVDGAVGRCRLTPG